MFRFEQKGSKNAKRRKGVARIEPTDFSLRTWRISPVPPCLLGRKSSSLRTQINTDVRRLAQIFFGSELIKQVNRSRQRREVCGLCLPHSLRLFHSLRETFKLVCMTSLWLFFPQLCLYAHSGPSTGPKRSY